MSIQIRCHGDFYAREGQIKLIRPFSETVHAPSLSFFTQTAEKYTGTDDAGKLMFTTSTFLNVRGILKKKLLPLILVKKFAGSFVRIKGVVIDEVTSTNPEETSDLPLGLMSIAQLSRLIKEQNIPLDPKSYMNVDDLRTDIMEYKEDPDTFKRNFAKKDKKRSEEREFLALNNLLDPQPKDQGQMELFKPGSPGGPQKNVSTTQGSGLPF